MPAVSRSSPSSSAIAGYFLAGSILHLLGTPGDAAPLALAYLQVIFLAMPALLLLTLMMMALRGAGDSLTPLWFMIVAVVLDSGLNPFFIRGFGPIPAMGIAGSAMSTLIGNYVSFFGLLIYLYVRDLPLRLRGAELRYLLPSPAILKTIIVKGFPMGLQMVVISMSALALIGLVNRQGVDTTAAFGVAMQLWTYVQMPAMAIGAAVSAMSAQNIGARPVGPGRADHAERDHPVAADYRRADRPADARRPHRACACSWAAAARRFRSRGTSTCSRPGTSCCSA